MIVLFPLVATGISAVFAVSLFRQYRSRRRLAQLAWGIALGMFAIASLALAAALGLGWDATIYRTFWLFGALLNVVWLAVGSIALVTRPAFGWIAAGLAALASAYATFVVFSGELDRPLLDAADGIPKGKDVWLAPAQVSLARWYSIVSWLIVVGIAVWSSRSRNGMRPPADRAKGNALIAAGVTIVAAGGFALSRVGRGSAFSIALGIGVLVMYLGFRLASRAPRYRVEEPGDSPT